MFHNPQLAATVTQQPIDALNVDAAILFSDILVTAESLGLNLAFPDKGGPQVQPAIRQARTVLELPYIPAKKALSYVFETIALIKPKISIPLIGFSGAPFTLASYFIDSSNHSTFEHTKKWMREDPTSFHLLLSKITHAVIDYLQEQISAGVDAIQVFDSWANQLSDAEFAEFSIPYLKQIADALLPTQIPLILFLPRFLFESGGTV